MPVISGISTKDTTTSSIADYQAIIDATVTANQALYDQQATLQSQISNLNIQLNTLNEQIAAIESQDVKDARSAIRILGMLSSGMRIPGFGG